MRGSTENISLRALEEGDVDGAFVRLPLDEYYALTNRLAELEEENSMLRSQLSLFTYLDTAHTFIDLDQVVDVTDVSVDQVSSMVHEKQEGLFDDSIIVLREHEESVDDYHKQEESSNDNIMFDRQARNQSNNGFIAAEVEEVMEHSMIDDSMDQEKDLIGTRLVDESDEDWIATVSVGEKEQLEGDPVGVDVNNKVIENDSIVFIESDQALPSLASSETDIGTKPVTKAAKKKSITMVIDYLFEYLTTQPIRVAPTSFAVDMSDALNDSLIKHTHEVNALSIDELNAYLGDLGAQFQTILYATNRRLFQRYFVLYHIGGAFQVYYDAKCKLKKRKCMNKEKEWRAVGLRSATRLSCSIVTNLTKLFDKCPFFFHLMCARDENHGELPPLCCLNTMTRVDEALARLAPHMRLAYQLCQKLYDHYVRKILSSEKRKPFSEELKEKWKRVLNDCLDKQRSVCGSKRQFDQVEKEENEAHSSVSDAVWKRQRAQ